MNPFKPGDFALFAESVVHSAQDILHYIQDVNEDGEMTVFIFLSPLEEGGLREDCFLHYLDKIGRRDQLLQELYAMKKEGLVDYLKNRSHITNHRFTIGEGLLPASFRPLNEIERDSFLPYEKDIVQVMNAFHGVPPAPSVHL